jgi:hypothetical protein
MTTSFKCRIVAAALAVVLSTAIAARSAETGTPVPTTTKCSDFGCQP